MKLVLLHGLGQTAADWQTVAERAGFSDVDCPELFLLAGGAYTYDRLLQGLEARYAQERGPLVLCGLSLGAMLALDYALRHGEKVVALVLIAAQDRAPRRMIDFQNFVFRLLPRKAFAGMGLSREGAIRLMRSMRSLDFTTRLSALTCPATILCGEKDRANLKAAKRLKERLPQARLHIVPGAGHEINRCAPEAILPYLRTSE